MIVLCIKQHLKLNLKKKKLSNTEAELKKNWVIKKKHVGEVKDLAVTRIRTWVIAATTQCTNHYTITACELLKMHFIINNLLCKF